IVSATWTSMESVGTGDQLSATLWNTFVANLNDLDTRLKSTASTWPTVTGGIAYTGGNVGIGTAGPGAYRMAIRGSDDTSGTGALWVSGLTAGTPGLMVRNDGNVGIGTATPGAKLDVNGTLSIAGATTTLGNQGSVKLVLNGTAGARNWQMDVGALSTGYLNFTPSTANGGTTFTTPVMVIGDTGNVGIGTIVPRAKIHTLGQTFMMGSTTDLVWGSVGSVFQGEFGAASGNTYTKLESFINGGSGYGDIALNPGGGTVTVGSYEAGVSKLKVIQSTVSAWAALIKNTSTTVGENYGLTIRAGTNSTDSGFSVMDKTSANYHLHVRGDGNIGIGTASPGAKLQINSTTGESIRMQYNGNSGFARISTDAANSLILDTVNLANSVVIKDVTGNVGIGTASP
ncbi:MAG: hypothetical protein Q8K26_03445, partial [Candidatus Gracilibacteria bacterium]|nr:hypothetical protein [Candidatus Gracilibacteria bacterium]